MTSSFQKIGFFDHVDDVIASMQDCELSKADFTMPNFGEVGVYVVHQKTPFSSVIAADAVGEAVSLGFRAQMSEEDRMRGPDEFLFAAGIVNDQPRYFINWPEQRYIDFEQLRDSVDKVKLLLKQTDYEGFKQLPNSDSYVCLGPFSPADAKLVTNVIGRILSYQSDSQTPLYPDFGTIGLETPDGMYWGIKRAAYLGLFEHEQRYSPLIGGDKRPSSPPPSPPPPAGCD